ncbi:peptidoglycan recognition protein family protein [Peribacillus frigoritolerans]|uniref:peptidoglycan recognition protein family protein n=1 Tax=Peribacillus frigoritolerans TaxID=450367 RepID=UPI0023DA4D9D|nr:N-acetylmuramoyl-L-alanine amidase [Peribacillus frigoritolerans]MDF1997739.1 N-acetylmuramoyl-L-alanine amidase [Peribacillus frigoritolerans]
MRTKTITHRVWHHSLTKKNLGGSDAESFADYHVNTLGWPGGGYTFIIEPKNLINTPNGKRARIVYANDIDRRTYHVGNSNQFSLGICVAGDYRYDTMDEATLASNAELHAALVKDGIGQFDKAHNEMPGYGLKKVCCQITTEMHFIGKVQRLQSNHIRLLRFIQSKKVILYGALHIRMGRVEYKLKI